MFSLFRSNRSIVIDIYSYICFDSFASRKRRYTNVKRILHERCSLPGAGNFNLFRICRRRVYFFIPESKFPDDVIQRGNHTVSSLYLIHAGDDVRDMLK